MQWLFSPIGDTVIV